MEITDVAPDSRVLIRLEFFKPWKATNTTDIMLNPGPGGTSVIWAMHGPSMFMGKVMSVFVSMDKLMGKDFERGLANLKRVAEE